MKKKVCDHEKLVRHIIDVSKKKVIKKVAENVLHNVKPFVDFKNPYIGNSYGSCTFVNAPSNETVHQKWHRDTTYKSYIIIIPLVNIDSSNGCTQILPDSSHLKPRQWRKKIQNVQNIYMSVGDMYMFDGRLLHRGTANYTCNDRPILILTVTEEDKIYYQETPIF